MSVFPSPAERISDGRRFGRIALVLLLAGTSLPAHAGAEYAIGGAQVLPDEPHPQEILVIGERLFADIVPESELDEIGIESYGVSTIDELVTEIQGELGEDEEPLILVNGERVSDLSEIGAFPVEVLRKVQVLPRGSAVRAGGRTGQRVVSLNLHSKARSATVTAAPRFSTSGDWSAARGETLLTYIQGNTRANLGVRFRGEGSLLESERNIIQPDPNVPFALAGNVVAFPTSGFEIDPLLSALAGQPVTVTPLPAGFSPTLVEFAAIANQSNTTDLGDFRTLRPRVRNYDINGTYATRLATWLTGNAAVRLNRNENRSLRGLPSGLFVLAPSNSASPFSTDVGLAYYGPQPLQSELVRRSAEGRITLNGRLGKWRSNFNTRYSEARSTFDTERQSNFGGIPLADTFNPFANDPTSLITTQTDRSTSNARDGLAQLSFTGPLVALPAGNVTATLEGRLAWNNIRSRNSSGGPFAQRRFSRNEQSIRAALDIPLVNAGVPGLAGIGDLGATAELGLSHYSDAGSLDRYAFGLAWEPRPFLRLRGSIEQTERPASMQILGSPVIETSGIRTFDPLSGQTVDLLQITGGNPDILPERHKVKRLSALVRPVTSYDLQVSAEYTDSDTRNYISALPPASLPVMLAFPDRFLRDSDGRLTAVDLRPVNFDSHREKGLRWGLSMRKKVGSSGLLGLPPSAGPYTDTEAADDNAPSASTADEPARGRGRPATYVQVTANHTVIFSDEIRIRPGLGSVDLLEGGAIGIASGRVRHQLQGTAAITSGGLGARLGVTWRGRSTLDTRIGEIEDTLTFSPLLAVNLRAFADARRFLPNAEWARGLRVSVDVVNVLNDRQKVRDSFGNTPLQYQPAYRDPLGRTIEFEIRKVF